MQAEIRLLGPGRVRGPDGNDIEAQAWRTAKTYDLLRVLALAEGRPLSTDTLVDLFWPTTEAARGRTSLRTAASQIRKVLGCDSVVRVGNGLALRGVWVDTQAYRSLAADIQEAMDRDHPATVVKLVHEAEALYTGDLDVTGTDCSILHDASAELQALRGHLLLEAAEAAGRCSGWRQSLEFAKRASAIEISDRSARALMHAWFALGETGKPIQEFERLRRHLAVEYGVDPAPQTRALYLHLVSECAQWPPHDLAIGRDEQIDRVTTAVTGRLMDPDRPSGVVWLVGERGSGRKTVAREAARTLTLPLCERPDTDDQPAKLELLPDQDTPTWELAAALRSRAAAVGRVLLVPVSEVPADALPDSDAIVPVPPLDRKSFRKLLTITLQGRPTFRLEEDLYAETRGLPGLACRRARLRLHHGTLNWTTEGVDLAGTRLRANEPVWVKVRATMALVPIAWLGLVGSDTPGSLTERSRPESPAVALELSRSRALTGRRRPDSRGRSGPGRRGIDQAAAS
jgi:DNA-binding SARP family transcriptional activator